MSVIENYRLASHPIWALTRINLNLKPWPFTIKPKTFTVSQSKPSISRVMSDASNWSESIKSGSVKNQYRIGEHGSWKCVCFCVCLRVCVCVSPAGMVYPITCHQCFCQSAKKSPQRCHCLYSRPKTGTHTYINTHTHHSKPSPFLFSEWTWGTFASNAWSHTNTLTHIRISAQA